MSEENVQDTVQESQETKASNNQESPSDPNYKQEMMKYKTQRNEAREENTLLKEDVKAKEEKGRQKKLAEEGKYKELDAEKTATIEKLMSENEYAKKIIAQQKIDIINSITSDDAKREELATKDIETLRFIQNEIGNKVVNNPTESLGATRMPKGKFDITKMTAEEKRENWDQTVASYKK